MPNLYRISLGRSIGGLRSQKAPFGVWMRTESPQRAAPALCNVNCYHIQSRQKEYNDVQNRGHDIVLCYALAVVAQATFFCCAGADLLSASDPAAGWGATGRGPFLTPSSTLCACSVFRMNHPAKRRPTVTSEMWTMFCAAKASMLFSSRRGRRELTSLMTKSISLVEIICPSRRFFSVPTRLTDLLAALTAIICCTISSSSASRKLASLAASSDVYSLRKLRSVGTAACARTSATNSARWRWAGSVTGSSAYDASCSGSSYGGGLAEMNLGHA